MKLSRKLITFTLLLLLGACNTNKYHQINDEMSKEGLSYDVVGKGPLIVLIHGSNLDRRMWSNEVGYLQKEATILLYDQKGLGASKTPLIRFSNHDGLIDLLNEIGANEVILVGLSSGAQIAIDVALVAPEMVKRMILVSPSLYGYVPKQSPPYLSKLISALQANDFTLANEVLLNSSIMDVPESRIELVRRMVVESRQWILPYSLMQLPSMPAIENLDSITIPTMILVGKNDVVAIHNQGKFLNKQLQNAKLIVVDGGGHLLNMTSPNAFRKELVNFVKVTRK